MRNFLPRSFVICAAIVAALLVPLYGQSPDNSSVAISKPELIDEFGRLGDCDFGARVDNFLINLRDNPSARGVVILYNGYDVLPSEYESPPHERLILSKINFRRADASRFTFVRGGFRETMTTEFWLVRPGAENPQPTNVLPDPILPANRAYKYDSEFLDADYESVPDAYVLPEALEKQRKEREDSWVEEPLGSVETDEVEETSNTEEAAENERNAAEALNRFKTHWVSVLFAKHLYKIPSDSGMLIFYADDEYYNVPKLRELVDEQVAILAREEQVEAGRLKVIFGGYRDTPVVEYWVVPRGATEPVPTPGKRRKDCDGECEEQ